VLYPVIFHFLAGAVTGSLFKVRTLLLLLLFVIAESAMLALAQRSLAGSWALVNLVGVQTGYLAGIYIRGIIEHAGYSQPSAPTRRLP
jgi:hypothetical protein